MRKSEGMRRTSVYVVKTAEEEQQRSWSFLEAFTIPFYYILQQERY
jgi:hypothetical protein